MMLPSIKASGFNAWMASMVCWIEAPLRAFAAISHRVSRGAVVCCAVAPVTGALTAGAVCAAASAVCGENLEGSSSTL
ncbi:hypothetical protein D3C80_1296020 [compost metagenome]